MPFWLNKKQETQSQAFSDLIRGLQHSVNAAMEMLEARNLELLSRYFTEDGHPCVRRLMLDDNSTIDVPVISIVNPSAMNLKEIEMEFSVKVNSVELQEKLPQRGFIANETNGDLSISMERSNLQISFTEITDQNNTMKVKIKFESAQLADGMSRMIKEFDKTISPAVEREI